jgi:hypothetical protein
MAPLVATETPERTMLREAHRVRPLSAEEEGTGILQLPGGVFGFTHAPAAENAPLFRTATAHSFEVHRLTDAAILLAYVDKRAAAILEHAPEDFTVLAYPFANESAPVLVVIEWSRLRLVKRYVTPAEHGGIELQIFGK